MGVARSIEEINTSLPVSSRLKVDSFDGYYTYPSGRKHRMVLCTCSCGKKISVRVQHVLSGAIVSCGCKKVEDTVRRNTKYSTHHNKLNSVYHGMMSRCYDKGNKQYKNYGGRGVTVCEEWGNDYEQFLKWALLSGWQEGYDLDKDKLGNGMLYSPQTCCFLPKSENRANTSRTKKIEINGSIVSHTEACRLKGIDPTTVNSRIERGWDLEDALNKPLRINQWK